MERVSKPGPIRPGTNERTGLETRSTWQEIILLEAFPRIASLPHPEHHNPAIQAAVFLRGIARLGRFSLTVADRHETVRAHSIVDEIAGDALGAFLREEQIASIVTLR